MNRCDYTDWRDEHEWQCHNKAGNNIEHEGTKIALCGTHYWQYLLWAVRGSGLGQDYLEATDERLIHGEV